MKDEAIIFHRETKHSPGGFPKGRGGAEPIFFKEYPTSPFFELPDPPKLEKPSLTEVISRRRSRRTFVREPITLNTLSGLLYYTLGVTERVPAYGMINYPLKAAPSAGALNPIELYVASFMVEGLKGGLYHYNAIEHGLSHLMEGDLRDVFERISMGQEFVRDSAVIIIFTAFYERTRWRYGLRGYRYVHIDGGCAGENLYLVAEAFGLGTVMIGAFYDDMLADLLQLEEDKEFPLFFMPVGKTTG
jgi:SagB-type dehydrogenase family enzyme